MRKEQFDITGMTCSACSSRVESCVRKLPGVKDVSVNLLKNSMSVSYDENGMNTEGIVGAVESSGYGAKPKDDRQNTKAEKNTGQYGAGRIQRNETTAMAFGHFHPSSVLYFDGAYDELAPAELPFRNGKCHDLCFYPVSALDTRTDH